MSGAAWRPWQRMALVLALLLALARLLWVVGHQPLAGFGNQFDMLRTTACLGLLPEADVAFGAATPQAPVTQYLERGGDNPSCLPGIEVLLVAAILAVDELADRAGLGDPERLSLRSVAWGKALLLLAVLAFGQARLRHWPGPALAHAWIVALLLLDPFNTLYLAGFYTEIAALTVTWLALLLPLGWLLAGRRPGLAGWLGWGLCLAALPLARFQHLLIAPGMLLLFLLWQGWARPLRIAQPVWWSPRCFPNTTLGGASLAALLILLATLLQAHWQREQPAIDRANRINSLFGAALPASANPPLFLQRAGLPQHCAELVHLSWYLPRGRDVEADCPQALHSSRLRWSLALAAEPGALLRLFGRGLMLSGQWRPGYLGELAGQLHGRMPAGPLGLGASVADGVAGLSFRGLYWLWAGPLLLLACTLRREAAQRGPATSWVSLVLLLVVASGWLSSLLGDGYSELARHLHLAANAALTAWLLLIFVLLKGLADLRRLPASAHPRRSRTGTAALPLALTILLLAGGSWLLRAQALAFGVLDEPAGEDVAVGPLDLRGWAMAPSGVAMVSVQLADGRRLPLTIYPATGLAAVFGPAAAATAVHFEGSLELSPGPGVQPVAILVSDRQGGETVIDRRWLRPGGSLED